ncbi:MAG TPA: alpha-1,2-fucosyltransferase [Tepidisphaeraceae bacterium]|jgi:hypothetical protein
MFDRVFRPAQNPSDISWDQFLNEPAHLAPVPSIIPYQEIWQGILDHKHSTALIIAPHAEPHPDFQSLFSSYWSAIPQDWDIVCLGAYYSTPPAHLSHHTFAPGEISQVHGYALRDRACAALLQRASTGQSLPQSLTSLHREHQLKIYSVWPNLICPISPTGQPQDLFNSFHQLGQHGRMGNQFFQVAATLGAAVRHGYRPMFPAWRSSQILLEHFDQFLDTSQIAHLYKEPEFHYSEIPHSPNLDLTGFFQSPLYFQGYEPLIRQYLQPSLKLKTAITTRFAQLLAKPTVALHIRRADYIGLAHAFTSLPIDYYRAAMRLFPPGHHFAVFTDDPAWCRWAFQSDNVEIIEGNPGYADLFLMSACQHQIIANSSFSWWAAWLNPNPAKRIIAPKNWFGPALSQNDIRDLIPANWIIL